MPYPFHFSYSVNDSHNLYLTGEVYYLYQYSIYVF
jgi:hypothetical protein